MLKKNKLNKFPLTTITVTYDQKQLNLDRKKFFVENSDWKQCRVFQIALRKGASTLGRTENFVEKGWVTSEGDWTRSDFDYATHL